MFRVLTPGASDDDIRNFKDIVLRINDAAYLKSADNVFQVSISANEESYARLYKEDPEMCEAMRRLMKDDFIKTEARGEIKGAIKLYRDEMGLLPAEISKKIMIRFNLKQDVAERYVEETLGLQLA